LRPPILYPLFAPVGTLKGLGPKLGRLAEKLAGPHVVDLLWHLPTGLIDRRFAPRIADAPDGRVCTLTVRIDQHVAPANTRQPYRILASDGSGTIEIAYFRGRADWLGKLFPIGAELVVSGRVEWFNGRPQIVHPDHVSPVEAATASRPPNRSTP
jgi:ATP-dependent DNA helicase RecG